MCHLNSKSNNQNLELLKALPVVCNTKPMISRTKRGYDNIRALVFYKRLFLFVSSGWTLLLILCRWWMIHGVERLTKCWTVSLSLLTVVYERSSLWRINHQIQLEMMVIGAVWFVFVLEFGLTTCIKRIWIRMYNICILLQSKLK